MIKYINYKRDILKIQLYEVIMLLIITPAFLEDENILKRNILSVKNQNFNKDYCHSVIFDGVDRLEIFKKQYANIKNLFFFQVKNNHDDYGDYIRRLGTKICLSRGFNAISYLDADNYIEENHLKQIYDIHKNKKKNIVISRRRLLSDSENVIETSSDFYDTNTITLFNDCIQIGLKWGKYPRELSLLGDRIISHYINLNYRSNVVKTDDVTINYMFSKISKQKQDNFRQWYLNYFSNYKDKFVKTFGYNLKI